jgi:hypothetical protein
MTDEINSWLHMCRCFGPGGPSTEPTNEFIAACPCPDGLAQDGTQGGMYYLAPGVLIVGVTSVAREREREPVRLLVPARPPPPPAGRPWTSLL